MKYSKEDRATVVAFLYASGFPQRRGAIKYTSVKTGVHHKQVRQWSDRIDHFVGLENLENKMIDLKML